ncbi:MAG TPA: HEAT repeat domain-containing protein [Urbifossiella sp.]|nr:HEAT repeat domain-containing protein [Urbifossiella sp.]
MYRVLPIAGLVGLACVLTGCAGALDTITSRQFRKEPFDTTYRMFKPQDPLVILWADPPKSGDERAKAMLRLQEPLTQGLTQTEQDEVMDTLAQAATVDPSPVLRLAAIAALGRFKDARAPGILMLAYQNATGKPDDPQPVPVARVPGAGRPPLAAPTGFAPEVVVTIRSRVLEGLGRSGRPEIIPFLASVAAGSTPGNGPEGSDDREIRLAAIRGLGVCRHPDAVVALSQVMSADAGKDPAVTGRAHDGLVSLTGQRIPADPARWNQVVQAGVTIAPEPNAVDRAVHWVTEIRLP